MRRRAGATSSAALIATMMPLLAGAAELKTFRSDEWGVTVRYPADLIAGDTFKTSYFDRGAWRVSYAADTGPGTRLLSLSLPDLHASDEGGESKGTAELRIGASHDPDVVSSCLTYGMNSGNDVEKRIRSIGGIGFTEVPDNNDAEMSKSFRTDDLRAVHNGICYAIDLVVFIGGTSNKQIEFAPADLQRLRDVLGTIRFD